MPRFFFLLAAIVLTSAGYVRADLIVTNGDFGTLTTAGWITTGTVDASSGSAILSAGSSIHQDFSNGSTETADNYDFQLEFTFSVSALNQNQRIRIRDNANAGDIVTLRLNNGLGIQSFAGQVSGNTGFGNALSFNYSTNTTYHFRMVATDWDLATRFYTLGLSTDGINYTTSGNLTVFHSAPVGSDFETLRVESGAGTALTLDNVTAVPEPTALALVGLAFAVIGGVRRRRR